MPNLFDSFSLGQQFAISSTQRSLTRVASAITNNAVAFDRTLLNDEAIRERAKIYKDGIDWDRERLSALISKVQQLQGRLQATYQSMLDRMMSTNAAEVGTAHDLTDIPDMWTENQWKDVGRGPLQFSKAANADSEVVDDWTQGSSNLGRLDYYRVDQNGTVYQERGSYFTTLDYLWQFDLHQLRYTYATGTLGPGTAPGTAINQDQMFEMDAVDYNKTPVGDWKLGDVIKLDPAKIFTTDFMNKYVSTDKFGNIRYMNGSGYQFDTPTELYAYVREVEYLPDGVTKPKVIDMITGPVPIDFDGDEVPDNAVKMDDFLQSITTDDIDMTLTGDAWSGNTGPLGTPGSASSNGWVPWNGNTNPVKTGATIWSVNPTGQISGFTKTGAISGEIDVLRHPALNYSAGSATNDDDGMFYWTRVGGGSLANDGAGGDLGPTFQGGSGAWPIIQWVAGGDPDTGWQLAGFDGGGGASTWDVNNAVHGSGSVTNPFTGAVTGTYAESGISSMDLVNNDTIRFSYTGLNGYFSGNTSNSGQGMTGTLKIEKINQQADAERYVIDQFGNIFDKFGYGNTNPDYYDYVPNVKDNAKGNYVGNIFGNNTREARKVELDGSNQRTTNNGVLDSNELFPLLEFASRDYDAPDDPLSMPNATQNPEWNRPTLIDPDTAAPLGANSAQNPYFSGTVFTYNPSFAGVYMGFSDAAATTIGVASSETDKYGNNMNLLRMAPFRTSDSVTAAASVNGGNRGGLIDRDYQLIPDGTKVQIVDNLTGVVTGVDRLGNPVTTGTITYDTVTGTYVVRHDDAAVTLDPSHNYTITTVPEAKPRQAGSMENSFTTAIKTILSGNEYKQAIKDGLLDDIQLSASSTDAFSGMMSGKLTISYNKRQERVELYQNSFAAIYKSDPH